MRSAAEVKQISFPAKLISDYTFPVSRRLTAHRCTREEIERISFTYDGGNIIRIHCNGHAVDDSRSCSRVYWLKGNYKFDFHTIICMLAWERHISKANRGDSN